MRKKISHREGITFFEIQNMFSTEEAAVAWFEDIRWPGGEKDCPHCASANIKNMKNGKPLPFRCGDCRKFFSVRAKTALQKSKLPLRKWAVGIFLMSSSLHVAEVSSMRLHRELGITQKTAGRIARKIDETKLLKKGSAQEIARRLLQLDKKKN